VAPVSCRNGIFDETRPDLSFRAQSPNTPFTNGVALHHQFVREESIPKGWIITVGVDQQIGEVGIVELTR